MKHYIATYGGQPVPLVQAFLYLRQQDASLARVTLIDDPSVPQTPQRLAHLKAWFEREGVTVSLLSGGESMRLALPPLLGNAHVNVTGGTKELALRVADVALTRGCTVFVTDAHTGLHRIHFLSGGESKGLGRGIRPRDVWELSHVAGRMVEQVELPEAEANLLDRHREWRSGALLFAHEGARSERDEGWETERFSALDVQDGIVRVLALSSSDNRQDVRTFAEFVRRTFGDVAVPTWASANLRKRDLDYVQRLGTVLDLKEAGDRLSALRPIPEVPTLRGDVLVCVLGKQPMPAIVAALHGQAGTVVLVTTEPQVAVAGRVGTFLAARGVNVEVALLEQARPRDFQAYMQQVCAGLAGSQKLRLNISGGTKAMALNAFLGTQVTEDQTVEYTRGQSIITLRPERLAPVRVPVSVSFRERLNLLGLDASEEQLRNHTFRNKKVRGAARNLLQAKGSPTFGAALDQFRSAWTENELPAALLDAAEGQALADSSRLGANAYGSRWLGFAFEVLVYAELVDALNANQPGHSARAALGVEVQQREWQGDAQSGQDVARAGGGTYEREADTLLEMNGNIVLVEAKLGLMRGVRDAQEHLDAVELAQRLGGRYTHTAIVGLRLPNIAKLSDDDRALWQSVLAGSSLAGAYSLHVVQSGNPPLPAGVWHWGGGHLEANVNEIVKEQAT